MPLVLNSESPQGFEPASTFPVLPSGGTVHLLHPHSPISACAENVNYAEMGA